MDKIENLIESYFEGTTSAEEEAALRRFFMSGNVPEKLAMYKPLFVYIEDEIKHIQKNMQPVRRINRKQMLWIGSAAACVVLLIGIFLFSVEQKRCPAGDNYVMINGRCYTDAETIHSAMQKTLREVSDDDDFFFESASGSRNIIENQLQEFESLFNE